LENTLVDWAARAAMFGLMFGMGLTLVVDDFRRVARAPLATVLGTALQLFVMPLVGIGLVHLYELPPVLGAGLVVAAACPGGMFSNVFVYIARANGALSVTLTATATLVTLFTLPLWVRYSLAGAEGPAGDIVVPIGATALQLAGLTVVPVVIGMAVRGRWPSALKLEKWLSRFGAIAIIAVMIWDSSQRSQLPLEELQRSLAPALWLACVALVLGLTVPRLFGLSTRDSVTIAVELVVKNMLLGIVLARQSLEFNAMVPMVAFSIFETPLGVALLVGWRLLAGWGWLEGPAPRTDPSPHKGAPEPPL